MSVKEAIQELAHNPKIAAGVSTVTTGTGLGTVLDFIPDDIGKLATLIGIVLSFILIRVHWAGLKKVQLEVSILKTQEAERVERAKARRKQGEALRRHEDMEAG